MYVQSGGKPLADFSRPIQLMMDCHRRVEHFLGVLLTVARQRNGGALDEQSQVALRTALRYFESAAPRHTADEEQSLFPRLRASASDDARSALGLMARLEADHQAVRPLHERVAELGWQWLRDDRLDESDAGDFTAAVAELQRRYAEHIRIEDEQVFPVAARALDAAALAEVGREMAARRMIEPGRAGSRCARRRSRMRPNRLGD